MKESCIGFYSQTFENLLIFFYEASQCKMLDGMLAVGEVSFQFKTKVDFWQMFFSFPYS